MVNAAPIRLRRSPFSRVPPAGTKAGDQKRSEFLHDLLAILGDARALWLPKKADTTATTGASRNASAFTYDATIASRITALGSGVQVAFDGDNDEADTPDVAGLSFGDGASDQPMSLLWLGKPDTDTSVQTLISKQNSASVDEYGLYLTATNSYPTFDLIDASASGIIGRSHDTGIGTSAVFIAATYNGSRAVGGINLYKDAALVDDGVGGTTGSYTAMEDTASLVRLGTRYTANEGFYNGKMALAAVVAKELSSDELWAIKELINAFYDLTL
jgi:hypothetical protein